jgi:Exocyst complex component Sec6.
MGSSIAIRTVFATLYDYFQDYVHLRVRNFDYVISEAQNWVAKRYISAMLQKKMSFKTYEERRDAAVKIMGEAEQVKEFFIHHAPKVAKFDSPFDIINTLAEVLKSEDPEILSLDLHGLVDKYPDVTQDHLIHLLSLRGDISRSEAKEKVAYILQTNKTRQRPTIPKSIFSLIP